jgi:CRP/FNR family cyclic AMP-dependent transcriptional regulator
MDDKRIIALMKATSIFSRMSEASLRSVLKSAVQKTSPAGTKIVQEGKGGVGFYLILEGKAEVIREGEKLAELGVGNFFGELSVIDGAPRTADVIAMTDTSCLVITQWAMKSLIENHPEIAQGMLAELVRRLRATDEVLHAAG